MKKTVSLTIVVIMLISIFAPQTSAAFVRFSGSCGEKVKWELYDEGVLKISGSGKMTNYGDVKEVPWNAYQSDITSVVVEEGVESVGDRAFYFFDNLSEVSLSESVVYIGEYSFSRCYDLTSISIPDGVASIGKGAFEDSYKLKKVGFGRGIKIIGDYAFASCAALKTANLSSSVIEIGEKAFFDCVALESVSLPDNLEIIGNSAFESCLKLEAVSIPGGVKEIKPNAFFYCLSLKSVFLEEGTVKIGDGAFLWCPDLERILLPDSILSLGEHSVGCYYYDGAYRMIEELEVIASRKTIGASFAAENNYTHIIIDAAHKCGTKCEFCGRCIDLECLYYSCYDKCRDHFYPIKGTFGEGVNWVLEESGKLVVSGEGKIDDFAYNGSPIYILRKAIKDVEIKPGVTEIGNYAFNDCYNMTSLSLPATVSSIGFKSFYGAGSLKSLTLPARLVKIGDYAFAMGAEINSLEIPDSVLEIGRYAFYKRPVSSLKIGGGVESIGASAFEAGDDLKSIILPSSIKSIGNRAFGFYYQSDGYKAINGFKVYGSKDSAAPEYAAKYGLKFIVYPWNNPFDDVADDAWYYDAVKYVNENGLMGGNKSDTTFEPMTPMNRAMLVTLLWRAEGEPTPSDAAPFDDLSQSWYLDAVAWAVEEGITDGVGDGKFAPDLKLSRETLAAMIFRYTKYKGVDTSGAGDLDKFPDGADVSSWAEDGLKWAVGTGILNGKETDAGVILAARTTTNRAEVATMISRLFKAIGY